MTFIALFSFISLVFGMALKKGAQQILNGGNGDAGNDDRVHPTPTPSIGINGVGGVAQH